MKIWALLAVAAITVLSRRCVTHHEAGALLRDHQLEGQLTEDQIRIIKTGAIYTKFRGSNLEGGLKGFENLLKWPRDH